MSILVSYKRHKIRLQKSCGFIVAVMGDSNQCELGRVKEQPLPAL